MNKPIKGLLITGIMFWSCLFVLVRCSTASAEWTAMNSGVEVHLYDVWGLSSSQVYAVGEDKTVLFFDGETWTTMDTGEPDISDLKVIWGTSATNIYAAGEGDLLLRYNGTEWVKIDDAFTGTCYGIWGSGENDMFFAGTSSRIVHYDGIDFTETRIGSSAYLDLWGTASNNVYAVGQLGTIMRYIGSTWQEMESGLTNHPIAGVWGSSASDVFAVASIGEILHSTGSSWTAMETGTSYTFCDVWGNAGDNVYAVGASGALMKYDGTEWGDVESNTDNDLNGVWVSSDGVVFVVGENGHILQNGEAGPGPVVPIDINVPDAYLILTNEKTYTLPAGTCTHVYGTSDVNTIVMEANSGVRLFNFTGANTIQIESAFDDFTVSRDGATVTFEGSDGTLLVVAATEDAQSLVFSDQTLEFVIVSGSVMLGDQVIP